MRDIRGDLEERVKLIENEATLAVAQFNKKIEELRREHSARVSELKAELDALSVLMESEHRRMASSPSVLQRTAQGSLESERKHIGDRIRQIKDEGPAPAAPPKNWR